MKFVTRERVRVDRVACPWLISRFIDPNAEFLFVPADMVTKVAQREDAIPFDVAGAQLGHHGAECSFDAFLTHYKLDDPALFELARIVRGADTSDRTLTAESAGLYAIASGFHSLSRTHYRTDHDLLEAEFPLYDALYAFCKERTPA